MNNNSKIEELLSTAWVNRRHGKYEEARTKVEQARALCQPDDYKYLGRLYHIYAQFESDHNKPRRALELYQQSLAYYQKNGNQVRIAHSTRHIADLQRKLGALSNSEKNYRQSLEIYRSNANAIIGDLANALRGYGLLLEKRGKTTEAILIWQEVKEGYAAINLPEGVKEANEKLEFLQHLSDQE